MNTKIIVAIIGIVVLNLIIWGVLLPNFINRKISSFQSSLVDKHYEEVEIMPWKHVCESMINQKDS